MNPEDKILDLLTRVYWLKGDHKQGAALLAAALRQAYREGAAELKRRLVTRLRGGMQAAVAFIVEEEAARLLAEGGSRE